MKGKELLGWGGKKKEEFTKFHNIDFVLERKKIISLELKVRERYINLLGSNCMLQSCENKFDS